MATLFSVGTQVVLLEAIQDASGNVRYPRGAVAIVIESFSANDSKVGSYRLRFADQAVETVAGSRLTSLAKFQSDQTQPAEAFYQLGGRGELFQRVILQCVIGSQAYGLATDASDVDRRGCYLAPSDLQWSIWGAPEQLELHETQECYWEVQKLIVLGLKANPSVLECLYSPIVERVTPLGQELLDAREIFLSQLVYQTFNGYVMSQFKRMQIDIRNRGEVRWKHVMHLLRLLHAGIETLEQGFVPVLVQEDLRERLLAIKRGEIAWEETERWRKELHRQFDRAARTSRLPEKPNYTKANQLLIHARRSALAAELP